MHAHIARAVRIGTNAFFRTKHNGRLVYQSSNVSKKVLTGQFVVAQPEPRHASAEPELRRDVACAARRSFLVRGTLVYQSSNMSKQELTGQLVVVQTEVHHARAEPEFRRDITCAATRSFIVHGRLVYS